MTSELDSATEVGSDDKPATSAAAKPTAAATMASKPKDAGALPGKPAVEPPTAAPADPPASAAEPTASAAEPKKSMVPVLVGGGVILAVFALVAFWPGGDDKGKAGANKTGAAGADDDEGGGRAGGGKGGVQAREYDEPSAPTRPGKRNPAVRLPNVGMSPEAPAPKDEAPPVFASKAEEIAWYERKLAQAKEVRDARQKFADRLPKAKERIEKSPNSDQQMQAFEQRKKIVEENYAKAQADVADLEKKLIELRGG